MENSKVSKKDPFAGDSSWWHSILNNFVRSLQTAGESKTVIAQKHIDHDHQ